MAELVNAGSMGDAETSVTVEIIHDEWSDPRIVLERDTWAAVADDGRYLAAVEVWFGEADYDRDVVTRHIGFTMRPELRESHDDLMEQLFARGLEHALSRPFTQPDKAYALRAWSWPLDEWKERWLLGNGFRLTHLGYTMVYDDMEALPPVPPVPGFRCVPGSTERDRELRAAVNEAFSSDPTYTPLSGAEWDVLFDSTANPDAHWVLAIEEATNRVVGFAVAEVDRETNEATGGHDGWVMDLAVLPAYRGHRLGRALVLSAMHRLRVEGMSAIKMGIDSFDPPEEATRLHRSLGFRILKGIHNFRRPIN